MATHVYSPNIWKLEFKDILATQQDPNIRGLEKQKTTASQEDSNTQGVKKGPSIPGGHPASLAFKGKDASH